jgi:hypothetical protein
MFFSNSADGTNNAIKYNNKEDGIINIKNNKKVYINDRNPVIIM